MANNENVNKVVYGNQTLIDITDTTAEENTVADGEVFYKASGARSVGTFKNVDPATATPIMDGVGAVGTSVKYAREDHIHPSDMTRAAATDVPTQASIDEDGLITYKNSSGTTLFTLQLPIYEPPVVTLITFTMPDAGEEVTCNADVGMTFADWCVSDYNTGFSSFNWAVSGSRIKDGRWVLQLNGTDVLPTDAIQADVTYTGFYDD